MDMLIRKKVDQSTSTSDSGLLVSAVPPVVVEGNVAPVAPPMEVGGDEVSVVSVVPSAQAGDNRGSGIMRQCYVVLSPVKLDQATTRGT